MDIKPDQPRLLEAVPALLARDDAAEARSRLRSLSWDVGLGDILIVDGGRSVKSL